jgi:uncharacterized protein (UPF0210 family)
MKTVVVIKEDDTDLPEQLQQFVNDLNWLNDEGYIDYVEDKDGNVRIIPVHGLI